MLAGSPFDIDYFSKTNSSSPANKNVQVDADTDSDADGCSVSSFASIGVFLAGVIAARFGLWTADLVTITRDLWPTWSPSNQTFGSGDSKKSFQGST